MSRALTVDDIWKLFRKTNRMFKESEQRSMRDIQETRRIMQEGSAETERMSQETQRRFQETERMSQETERMVQETQRMSQETERKFQETRRIMQEGRAETERMLQETQRESQETERVVREVSRQIGQLGGRWGEFVEGLVAPAYETLFAQRGLPVHKVSRQVKAKLPGNRRMEIDLLVVNTDAVVLVEVKSKLRHEDVRDHLARLAEFKDFFVEYADKRIMGAVAGIVVEENVDRFAMNEGLFVIVQSGDAVQLANDNAFIPRCW